MLEFESVNCGRVRGYLKGGVYVWAVRGIDGTDCPAIGQVRDRAGERYLVRMGCARDRWYRLQSDRAGDVYRYISCLLELNMLCDCVTERYILFIGIKGERYLAMAGSQIRRASCW